MTARFFTAIFAGAMPLIACGGSPVENTCANYALTGITLTVVDSTSLTTPPGTLSLIVTDAAYADTLTSAANGIFSAATERPGTYSLTLQVPGYHEWTKSPVVVALDGTACHHVVPVVLVAKVQKLSGP